MLATFFGHLPACLSGDRNLAIQNLAAQNGAVQRIEQDPTDGSVGNYRMSLLGSSSFFLFQERNRLQLNGLDGLEIVERRNRFIAANLSVKVQAETMWPFGIDQGRL